MHRPNNCTFDQNGDVMDAMEIQHEDDLLIIEDVARAVEENEFIPYVQPAFDLATDRVIAGETLVRWVYPEGNVIIPAGDFVPSLERTHTICGLDWCMIDAMSVFLGEVKQAVMPVSLNISSQNAEDKDFAKRLAATADWHKVPHGLLWVELSSQIIAADDHETDGLVSSVKEAGFSVVADKFDGDANMMRRLVQKGVGVVKVSPTLWRDGNATELNELVRVADELGIDLNVEGVENDEERQAITSLGFRYAQGFGLAHPMDIKDYLAICSK